MIALSLQVRSSSLSPPDTRLLTQHETSGHNLQGGREPIGREEQQQAKAAEKVSAKRARNMHSEL
eukprot:6008089-Pleurochrysis_carterae.AAC.1